MSGGKGSLRGVGTASVSSSHACSSILPLALWPRRVTQGRVARCLCSSSGAGDTGDTLLKQTQSSPSAPPSGQAHAFCAREDPWPRPGPPAGPAPGPPPAPPRRPVCPRPRPARPNPSSASPRPVPPQRARLADRAPPPVCRFLRRIAHDPSKPAAIRRGFESLSAHYIEAAAAAAAASGARASWLCFPTMGGTTSLCFWGYEQVKRSVANRCIALRGRVL